VGGDSDAPQFQTAEDGMAVLKVCEAARRAAETRCWVHVV